MCVSVHECHATSSFSLQYLAELYNFFCIIELIFISFQQSLAVLPSLILEMSLLTHAAFNGCVRSTVSINSNDNTLRFILLSHTFHKGIPCVAKTLNLWPRSPSLAFL